jgi:hypothetical protein
MMLHTVGKCVANQADVIALFKREITVEREIVRWGEMRLRRR